MTYKARFVPAYNSDNLAQFSSSLATGRIYYVIGSATGWATPSANNIISSRLASGSTATRYGNTLAPADSTAEFTLAEITPALSAGDYYIAYVWTDSFEVSDVTEVAFTVEATGGGGIPVLSGITLINIGTTYGTPRVTITFS
jgi:hypothetical protein